MKKREFSRLNPDHKLFRQLSERRPVWWQNIVRSVQNGKLYAEVRKDNYIDVYYNGGAILHRLSYTDGFRGELHFEYIPLTSLRNYVPLRFSGDSIEIDMQDSGVEFAGLGQFSENGIRPFQRRIGKFFMPSSEKGIQADFVLKNSCFIDTEFQYPSGKRSVRFDLVWVDVELRKLFVVELKTIGDQRLYFRVKSSDSPNYNKICGQLEAYRGFITEQNHNLLSHYERLFSIKRRLGILPSRLTELDSLSGFTFEERPILLIGDCNNVWIGANRDRLSGAIKDTAYGLFLQGKNTRRFTIPKNTAGNRIIFP